MTVIIGNARISENGTVNGAKGDSTGREVATQSFESGGTWDIVLRPKSVSVADKMADSMEKACENDNIGYSQSDRYSLYKALVANGFKFDKVGKCNTDCSQLVSDCCISAGVDVSPYLYTGNEKNVLLNSGQFEAITDPALTRRGEKLAAGDVLLRAGHTAIVTKGAFDRHGVPYKIIVKRGVVARQKPRKLSKQLKFLKKGTHATVREVSSNKKWGKVNSGWIALSYTKRA